MNISITPWALDTAREAADAARSGDFVAYRKARATLSDMIPPEVEAKDVIAAVVRWQMLNEVSEAVRAVAGGGR